MDNEEFKQLEKMFKNIKINVERQFLEFDVVEDKKNNCLWLGEKKRSEK